MSLPRREVKAGWVAQRGNRGMYRDAQAATATPDGLTFFSPPFLVTRAVLVGLDDGGVNHHVFIVCVLCWGFKDAPPHASSVLCMGLEICNATLSTHCER